MIQDHQQCEHNIISNLCHLTEIEMRFSYLLISFQENDDAWKNHPILDELPVLLSYVSLNQKNKNNLIIILSHRFWDVMEQHIGSNQLLNKRKMILDTICSQTLLTEPYLAEYATIEEQLQTLNYFVACLIYINMKNIDIFSKKNLIKYICYFIHKVDVYIYLKLKHQQYHLVDQIIKVQIFHIINHNIWEKFEKVDVKDCIFLCSVIKKLRKFYC